MSPTGHRDPLEHLNNDHHNDDLLAVTRAFSDHPDATAVQATGVDSSGIDITIDTPNGSTTARLDLDEPVASFPDGFRLAFIRLARRARTTLTDGTERTDHG